MRTNGRFLLIPLLVFTVSLVAASGHFQTDGRQVLTLSLSPAPLEFSDAPLPEALQAVGSAVRGGYVLFGVELRPRGGHAPTVSLKLRSASDLGSALTQILAQVPGYKLEVVSPHLIDIYPAGAKEDSEDLLNMHVARFDVAGTQQGFVLTHPTAFIPPLAARIAPAPGGIEVGSVLFPSGPTVTLHLRNVTVRQILNAVSEAGENSTANLAPLGWVSTFSRNPELPAGGKYSWAALPSAPRDWKQDAGG